MAIYTHGITVDDVLARYPTQNGTTITATSTGINTPLIEALILEAAGSLNAVLRRHAIDPAALDEEATELVRGGVIAYVIAECMAKMMKADQATAWRAKYDVVRRTIREMPEDLGASQSAVAAVAVAPEDDEDPVVTPWDMW